MIFEIQKMIFRKLYIETLTKYQRKEVKQKEKSESVKT